MHHNASITSGWAGAALASQGLFQTPMFAPGTCGAAQLVNAMVGPPHSFTFGNQAANAISYLGRFHF